MKKNIKHININRIIIAILLSIVWQSCVKQIEPDIETLDADKYVVSGILLDRDGFQSISVSRTSDLNSTKYIPISGCQIKVIRSDNFEIFYHEYQLGSYQSYIMNSFIDKSKSYKVQVKTPEGDLLESSYESFSSCPDVDKVYYEVEYSESANNLIDYYGYQFYIDLDASETDSRYYLYHLIETFEHHSPYPLEYWWNGVLHREVPPDYSKMYCWVTTDIKDVFPLSTESLSTNKYSRYKLNYTSNRTQRLQHTYSLLIEQMSLSKDAYEYWNQMRINLKQTGGMYNSQPIAVKGNLKNLVDGGKDVLGYFGTSSIKDKRIFVSPSPFEIVDNSCTMRVLRFGYREISWAEYPAYIYSESGAPTNKLMDKACVDCTKMGGVLTKPSYWP
ncbi:MAG: hypothetical protein DRI86_14455 [Bacteroidetes bacterium]|nr:MAG: hypothetical protein DRI86_14455 [Bacteroidota bacterium]